MTPEQALSILDRAASLAPLPRSDHAAVMKALEVLKALVAEKQTK